MLTTSSAHRQVRTSALKSIVKCGHVVIWREKWKPEETPNTWKLSEGTSRDTAKHCFFNMEIHDSKEKRQKRQKDIAAMRQVVRRL